MSNFVLTPNAVAKLRRAIAPKSGNTGAVAATGVPIDPDKFPPPFTVRWSASANQGASAWIIWLPGLGNLVALGGALIPTIGGISAAQGLPGGWYTIDGLTANSTAVHLVVTVVDLTGAATAELSGTPGQATTGETVYNIKVADISTSAAGAKSVKQYVDSIVTIGGSGGGAGVTPDNISTEFIPNPPSGTQPDGDEGELQIKGFKAGTPADQNTLPDYLQGVANIPSGGISIVCRGVDTNGGRQLFYLPLAALFSASSISENVSLSFIGDLRWNLSTHTLEKRIDSVNLKTGQVTQGNWTTITNGATTPISDIIPQSS